MPGTTTATRVAPPHVGMIDILDPTARTEPEEKEIAQRLEDLEGKAVGLLDNGKPNAGVLLARLGELLTQKYGVARVVMKRKYMGVNNPAGPLLEELALECQVVVTGSGD